MKAKFRALISLGVGLLLGLALVSCGEAATPLPSPTTSPTSNPSLASPVPATATPTVLSASPSGTATLALPPSATAQPTILPDATPSSPAPLNQHLVFALLADNRLVAVRPEDGVEVAASALAPPPPASTGRLPGHYLALSQDGKTLFVLAPGSNNESDRLSVVEVATGQVKATFTLAQSQGRLSGLTFPSSVYHALAVGPRSGRVYLVGNRFGSVIVTALDPASGQEVASWTARERDGRNWLVYQAVLADDEQSFYISYHGDDTTGIDRLTFNGSNLVRCPPVKPDWGCLGAHGSFSLYGKGMLATYGYPVIVEQELDGTIEHGFNTGLVGSHVTEFVVDIPAGLLYAVNTCLAAPGYQGGYSVVDLKNAAMPNLAKIPGEQEWGDKLIPPKLIKLPDPNRPAENSKIPCGERLALDPGIKNWLLVAHINVPPYQIQPATGGALLIVDKSSGDIVRSIPTSSAPLDLI